MLSEQHFTCGKEVWGNHPVINLKKLNAFVPYEHSKMEGLHCLKFLVEQNDFLCKIDLKDAYFGIPLSKHSSKYVRFKWSGNLYQFLCLCFDLGPALKVLTKLLAIPIAILRQKHWNSCLPGWYITDEAENCDSEGYIDFSVAKFGISHKSE